jgi:hypothetical protein
MNLGENWREPQNTLSLARNETKSGANSYSRIFSLFDAFFSVIIPSKRTA